MKLNNLSISDFLSACAIGISVVALLSSIKSCQISEKALEVSVLEYNSNRSLVLKGEVQGTSADIKVTPHDPSFLLQEVYYQFPSEIGTKRKFVSPPNYVLSLNREIDYFKKELAIRYRDESGKATIGENARMPFLVESFSTVKGQGHRDRSIYTLNFEFQVPNDPKSEPKIAVTGISFGSRIDRNENAEEMLEKAWAEAKAN
ncbi:hypothetical protein [Rhodoferax sp.]|uniref:hypothetical protein n=1 Tax=Rhodoferax sp. TaxID=50421 RepID=UPI002629AB5F|nr:hypothetical protein [Rhodoferax sp.]MDD2919728.1 hypothetical protein [Rhodoferax sp.]